MTDPSRNEQPEAEAVAVLVAQQLRAARTGVFRAYLHARERARLLADDERGEPERQGPTAS